MRVTPKKLRKKDLKLEINPIISPTREANKRNDGIRSQQTNREIKWFALVEYLFGKRSPASDICHEP